jgi:hypothetical protein
MATGEIKALVFADGVSVTAATPSPLGAGGGGGASRWVSPDGPGAPATQIGSEVAYVFPDSYAGELWLTLIVPASYQEGSPITLSQGWIADSTTLTVKLKATTYLVEPGTDAFTSTTDSYDSTNVAQSNGSPTLMAQAATLDLTASDGTINSVAVAPGDWLRVKLTRDYTNDTDTGSVYVLEAAKEVAYA